MASSLRRAGLVASGGALLGVGASIAPAQTTLGLAVPLLLVMPAPLLLAGAVLCFKRLAPGIGPLDPFTVSDVLLGCWALRSVARMLLRRQGWAFSRAEGWLMAFFAWAVLITAQHGLSLTPLARIGLYAAVGALLARGSEADRAWLVRGIVAYAALEVVMTAPDLFHRRLLGHSIGDPHQFGSLLLAALSLVVGGVWRPRHWRWVAVVLTVWTVGAATRGILLGLLVVWVLGSLRRLNRRRSMAVVALGVGLGFAFYGPVTQRFNLNSESAIVRRDSVSSGIEAVRASPLTGYGWGWTTGGRRPGEPQAAFNLYVNVWAALGAVGLGLLGGYLVAALKPMARQNRPAFLFCSAMLALGCTEMIWFPGSFPTIFFFALPGLVPAVRPPVPGVIVDLPLHPA